MISAVKIDELCDTIISPPIKDTQTFWSVALAGFPCLGKAVITKKLVADWGIENTQIFNSSSYIYTRSQRAVKNVSACSIRAYNLEKMTTDFHRLISKETISSNVYSWKTGNYADQSFQLSIVGKSRLILLGPLVSLPVFASHCDRVIFFLPKNVDVWVAIAAMRDTNERSCTLSHALRNTSKGVNDLKEIFQSSRSALTHIAMTNIIQYSTNKTEFLYQIEPADKSQFSFDKHFVTSEPPQNLPAHSKDRV